MYIFRLRLSLESGRRNALPITAKNELKLSDTYKVCVPLSDKVTSEGSEHVDSVSETLLQMFHSALLFDFCPARVDGDGNCMYRAVSLAMSGTENYHWK